MPFWLTPLCCVDLTHCSTSPPEGHCGSFQVSEKNRQGSSPSWGSEGNWKHSTMEAGLQFRVKCAGLWDASTAGLLEVTEGCLTLSGHIWFSSIFTLLLPAPLLEDQGSNPRAKVHLWKTHGDLAEISSLRNFFGSHLSAPFAFSPAVWNRL